MEAILEPILHVDMDAFFVEVERLDDSALVGVPVIVGGGGDRGVVAAASYEARRHGVHSAMPMARARRLCPQVRVIPPEHGKYRAKSRQVFSILESFTPRVEAVSVDEAFLDISGLRRHYPTGIAVATAIRDRVASEARLPSSVGVATSKFVAKLASEAAKPDGQLVVPASGELEFLHPLPVRALWGVGEATFAALEGLGVRTIGELAATSREAVIRRLGEAVGAHLWELAWARDPRPVVTGGHPKSISVEETYERDLTIADEIDQALFAQSERVARRLRKAGFAARTISIKVRLTDFTTMTRSHTFDAPIDLTSDIYKSVARLLGRVARDGRPVRLLGVGATGLVPALEPRQMPFDAETTRSLTEASDRVRARFGDSAINPARVVEKPQ